MASSPARPSPAWLHRTVQEWYTLHARVLPWREPGVGAWAVLVSEVMLQQTPVARVLPVWQQWMVRWPTPASLAAQPAGEAVRAWGRLGYPRRALRLHESARVITQQHGGQVPRDEQALRALPGVGDYTAAAVLSFAFGQAQVVLDTNVRRVWARVLGGAAFPSTTSRTAVEVEQARALQPRDPATASRWAVAVMEFGALVCTARSPACTDCPLATVCAWRAAGYPPPATPRRGQVYEGTDRQMRGRILAVLREAATPVDVQALLAPCPTEQAQFHRCLASLLTDGLVVGAPGAHQLP